VLDVGTGTGYHAAVLAALGGRVWSIERDPALSRLGGRRLAEAGIGGVELVVGDGSLGPARTRALRRDQRRRGGRAAGPALRSRTSSRAAAGSCCRSTARSSSCTATATAP
jgi:protein-L-isoaspartate(D-aspartate) O-methyltransferase